MKLFLATKAFIKKDDKILIIRESNKYSDGTNIGNYDVIGGRINPGEKFNESLLREIKEETGLEVNLDKPFFVNEVRINKNDEIWQIVRIFFTAEAKSDKVVLSDDHDSYLWINPSDYKNHNIIGNLHEVFEEYLKLNQ